jgi:hypothetical protein
MNKFKKDFRYYSLFIKGLMNSSLPRVLGGEFLGLISSEIINRNALIFTFVP